jgi:thiol-disulfide isomerase/thioredoxin
MLKTTLLIFIIAANCSIAWSQDRLATRKTSLLNPDLEKQRLSKIVDNQPFVVVFYTTECPICQKYVSILRGLADCFPSVKFVAVFTKINTAAEFQDFVKNTPLSNLDAKNGILPFLDKKNRLAHHLNATATPEAFLFDAKGNLKYRGAIDNWFFALGKYREAATEHYLSNAVSSFLKNEKIKIEKTTPIGCLIE